MLGIRNEEKLPDITGWRNDIFADYSGSDRKCGLIDPDGKRYLVKYAETHTRKNALDTSYVNNVLAEFLSSHILKILGYPVHDTLLAIYQGELVVACRNFVRPGEKLIEFGRFLRKHYDSGELGRVPDLKQMLFVMQNDEMLSPFAQSLWNIYWERFVGDALTGNFDRHMGNFGYLVSEDKIEPSPVYDNGSTLFPALSEQGMQAVLAEKKEILRRTFLFPKAALTVNGEKAGYYDMLVSGYIPALSEAVRKKVPEFRNKMPLVLDFINSLECLSETRKDFYNTILESRFVHLLLPAYQYCNTEEYDRHAYARLKSGMPYTEEMFETEYERRSQTGNTN